MLCYVMYDHNARPSQRQTGGQTDRQTEKPSKHGTCRLGEPQRVVQLIAGE